VLISNTDKIFHVYFANIKIYLYFCFFSLDPLIVVLLSTKLQNTNFHDVSTFVIILCDFNCIFRGQE